jgi:pyruvate/2-oxoglutarate dehydrogenase complex dihydrolipoamide acyltransferase (E2) component
MLNATVNADVTEITYHSNHNIGIAIDTPKGLFVPVIHQVNFKSIFQISEELKKLQVIIVFSIKVDVVYFNLGRCQRRKTF